ncbi:MAG: response regulator transcription factor [Candidatus Sulfotelmatobacter sp.]|jgi:DNA-binding NarL/FixJ family response regulator
MSAFRILLADDHPIFRFGLSSLLGSHEKWEVCGEAADGRDAVEKCKLLKPDLLILDICLPILNGLDTARQILKHNPAQAILILTAVDSEQVIRDCLEAGVRGWVFKSDGTTDLTTAVEAIQRRKSIFSSRVSNLITDGYKRHRVDPDAARMPKLSPREREVVQLVSEGKASKEVAAILNVTLATAETHRSNIMRKLELHSIAELVLYAVRNEIIHVQSASVLRFPTPPVEQSHPRATADYEALPEAVNGRRDIGRRSFN